MLSCKAQKKQNCATISTYATTAVPFSIVHGRPEIEDLLDLTLMRGSTAPLQCVTSGSGHHL